METTPHERGQTIRNLVTAGRVALELSHETTPHIDEQFMSIAARETSRPDAFFSIIDPHLLEEDLRPDSIRHNRTLLAPNPISTEEVANTLTLIDYMLGDQAPEIAAIFAETINQLDIFNNIKATPEKPGSKLLVVSNHLQLPDQGFTMGFFHKVAAEQGMDRLENYLTVLVGRVIGYFQLDKANVIDDILRKVGSVLKTFPSGGSEALTETEEQTLRLFRVICNHHTKQAFSEIISGRPGRIICMAPSGEQDKYDKDRRMTTMRKFGEATCQMMIDACQEGATVLPLFADYGTDASIVKFLEPRQVSSHDECHEIGQEIAANGTYARAESAANQPDPKHRFHNPIIYS